MFQGTDVLRAACGARHSARFARGLWPIAGLLIATSGLVMGAQATRSASPPIEETARRIVIFKGSVLTEPIRKLDLMIDESVLIRSEIAYRDATATPQGVVAVKLVKPYELILTGRSAGKAELKLTSSEGKTPVFQITVTKAPVKPAEPFKASVRLAPVQRVSLKKNKSMIIQTNRPCRRIQVLSPALAGDKAGTQTVTETIHDGNKSRRVTKDEPKEADDKHKDIIEAEIITPKQILLVGKWFGTTQLLLFTEDNECQILEVTVEADVDQLNALIAKEVPESDVRAKSVLQTIVLEGEVPDDETRRRISELAEAFSQGEEGVKDHMRLQTGKGAVPTPKGLEDPAEIRRRQLCEVVAQMAPGARVTVKRVLGAYVLCGSVPDAETAERIEDIARLYTADEKTGVTDVKNHMQVVGVQQVLLRCTVAEVSKQALRELGVNGWIAGDNVRDMFMVNQVGQINPSNIGAAADALVAPVFRGQAPPRIPFLTGENGIPLQESVPLSIGFPRVQMQLFIQALRQNSLARLLAEPNLVAISGQTASFLVGGEYAYPVPQEGGVPAVDFKEFGVRLTFTPTVLAGQRIRMRVTPEVSQPDDTIGTVIQNTAVPGKSTRQLETVVEIGNGQTLALAGLLNEQVRGVAQRIPGLGDIPVFGALFSSVRYQKNQTELLVLCTPELVSPINPQQVPPVPGEEMTSPNDWQLFGLQKLEGEKRPVPSDPERAMKTAPPIRSLRKSAAKPGEMAQLSLLGPWGAAEGDEGR